MKRIFFLISFFSLLCFFSQKSFAQGNLQFNQVLSYSGELLQGQTGPTWTVPSGKVWKLEYFTFDDLVLNNAKAANANCNNGPLWLKAGDQIRYDLFFYGANCCGAKMNYLVSIVEFNVVP